MAVVIYWSINVDRILINDLLVRCVIGVGEDERRDKQDIIINLALETDLRMPGHTDALDDGVDYSVIKKRIVASAEQSSFHLIEALAERIAGICLEHPAVIRVMVRVEKPTVLRFARSVAVEIMRGQEA